MIYAGTIAKIEEALDGSPMYTVATPNGAVYFPCFNASVCGGFDGKYMFSPIDLDAEVIICRVNRGSAYFIVSTIADSTDQTRISTSALTNLDMDEDYNGLQHEETEIRNTNSRINLSPVQDMTLSAPNMRMQVNGGVFRISQQGTSENYILNGQPFLDELFSYIAELESRINTLSETVNILSKEQQPTLLEEKAELAGKQLANAITPDEYIRLVELIEELAILVANDPILSTNIPSSNVAKSDCEDTKNTTIKVP